MLKVVYIQMDMMYLTVNHAGKCLLFIIINGIRTLCSFSVHLVYFLPEISLVQWFNI